MTGVDVSRRIGVGRWRAVVAGLVLGGCVLGCAPGAALGQDITGAYDVRGVNPGGGEYAGTCVISKTGASYKLTWTLKDGEHVGVGILDGSILSVAYYSDNITGVVSYRVERTDLGTRLAGKWAIIGVPDVYAEVLTRR